MGRYQKLSSKVVLRDRHPLAKEMAAPVADLNREFASALVRSAHAQTRHQESVSARVAIIARHGRNSDRRDGGHLARRAV